MSVSQLGALIMSDHPLHDNEGSDSRITDKTFVQMGTVVVICGALVSAIWWASAMNSKMDTVIEEIRTGKVVAGKVQDMESHAKILEARIAALEMVLNAKGKP